MLYAPRTWAATGLHALYQLAIILFLLALLTVGYNEQTDMFQWSEYTRWFFHNPIFIAGVAGWGIRFWGLWYAATTKDRWDKTLPVSPKRSAVFFLTQTPLSVRDLLARILLVWSVYFGIVQVLVLRGPAERFLKSSPLLASILNSLPAARPGERLVSWAVSILTPVVAYLWAKVEFEVSDSKPSLPFPHNFRLFYSTSGWPDVISRCTVLLVAIDVVFQFFRIPQALSIVVTLVPKDDQAPVVIGMLSVLLMESISVVLVLYGSYRLGLISYVKRRGSKTTLYPGSPLEER